MGLRRRLDSVDDWYLTAFERKKASSPRFRQASESLDASFTPSFQLRYGIPVMSVSALLLALAGAALVPRDAGLGWSLIGVGLSGVAAALLFRTLFKRRLQSRQE